MKNKFKLLGIIAIIAIMGVIVSSCGDNPANINPKDITYEKLGEYYYQFSWPTTGTNVAQYTCFIMYENTKTARMAGLPTYGYKYILDEDGDRTRSDKFNADMWYVIVPVYQDQAGKAKFGVRAIAGMSNSDIVWTKDSYNFKKYIYNGDDGDDWDW